MESVSPSSAAAAGQVRSGGHGGHALRKAHVPAQSAAATTADKILDKVSTRAPAYFT